MRTHERRRRRDWNANRTGVRERGEKFPGRPVKQLMNLFDMTGGGWGTRASWHGDYGDKWQAWRGGTLRWLT